MASEVCWIQQGNVKLRKQLNKWHLNLQVYMYMCAWCCGRGPWPTSQGVQGSNPLAPIALLDHHVGGCHMVPWCSCHVHPLARRGALATLAGCIVGLPCRQVPRGASMDLPRGKPPWQLKLKFDLALPLGNL